jgi:hypothetical protein
MDKICSLMTEKTLLRVQVPNDFSAFQLKLMEKGMANHEWVASPIHLHYFETKSLNSFLKAKGLKVEKLISDYPIEQFLSNSSTSYKIHPEMGHDIHQSRIFVDNYLFEQGVETYVSYYEQAAKLGFGRTITAFAKL